MNAINTQVAALRAITIEAANREKRINAAMQQAIQERQAAYAVLLDAQQAMEYVNKILCSDEDWKLSIKSNNSRVIQSIKSILEQSK